MISWARLVMLSCWGRLRISGMLLTVDEDKGGVLRRPAPVVSTTVCTEEKEQVKPSSYLSFWGTRLSWAAIDLLPLPGSH